MSERLRALEQEVEALKRALKSAEAENTKYKTLFDVSGDALSIIDLASGKFIECNQAAIDLHGVGSAQYFLNLSPSDLSPEYQPCGRRSDELAKTYIEDTLVLGPQLFQWVHSRLDGSTFQCLVSLTSLPLKDKQLVLAIGRDISELLETKGKLDDVVSDFESVKTAYLKEKEKFELFVNLAPVGIAINKMSSGEFDYVNKEFSRFSGYDVDELNQMDYWQLTPKKYDKQEQEQLTSLSKTGRYGPYVKEYIHKDGHVYPVQLSGVQIKSATDEEFICSVVQDISEQKAIESQLQSAKEHAESNALRLKLANDSAEIGVWEWDVETDELIWDKWMYKLYGITESCFSGAYEAWQNSVHPDDIAYCHNLLTEAVKGGVRFEPEFRVVHPNGNIRTIKASAEIIRNDKGKALRVIGVNYDVTEKNEAINALEWARNEAEKASKTKSEFLANMSHEIRTPMNAILGGLQMVDQRSLDKRSQIMLENATSSAQSLLTIINDILDYSKIEDNKLDLEQAPFLMTEVLKSVRFEVDGILSQKGIELITNIDEAFSDGWLGDMVRVKQICLNLVSNAVKFTEHGNVTVNLYPTMLESRAAIGLTVIDTGIGMSEEALKRVFERFSQADSSTTRRFGGTGLGMSITLSLVKMMGGTIDVQSQTGVGTTFTVHLPLPKATQVIKPLPDNIFNTPQLSGKRILIAEDNEINRMIVRSMLEKTSAKMLTVTNGKLAVEAATQKYFDIILMDIQMPEMDGVEAMLKIKAVNPTIPIVALTANAMVSDVKHYLQEGFDEHLSKPIDMNKLFRLLNTLIS